MARPGPAAEWTRRGSVRVQRVEMQRREIVMADGHDARWPWSTYLLLGQACVRGADHGDPVGSHSITTLHSALGHCTLELPPRL